MNKQQWPHLLDVIKENTHCLIIPKLVGPGVKCSSLHRIYILLLFATFGRSIFRSKEHVMSYERNARRSSCRSSCKVVV